MRAAVITGDRSVAVVTIDRPAPAAGEVLLDVSYCGVCGSDLHMLCAPDGFPPGHVLGHEFTGVVAELGPHADGWAVGDRVVVDPLISCGECDPCRTGHPNLCEQEGIDHGPGIGRQGAYAESVAVPAGMLRRLPATVSDADGALIDLGTIAFKELIVRGSLCSDEGDFTDALGYIAAGLIPCNQIVTTTASLDDAPALLADLRSGATAQVKVLFRPGH